MQIAIDATPAAVQTAGVGRYTRELLNALMQLDGDDQYVLVCAAAAERASALLDSLPPGQQRDLRRVPVPERVATAAWHRLRMPIPVELLIGTFDVFHGPDFVVPPSRSPRVVTVHDLSFLIRPELSDPRLVTYLRNALPRSLRAASQIIAVSSSVAGELAEAYPWARERIVAIPNGVRVPALAPGGAHAGPPTVLFVGTIEPRKNIPALLNAMRRVRGRYPGVRLVIAGRIGWRSDDIVTELRRGVADGTVEMVESPTDPQLDALYASATVFAYPSHYEGFGLPMLEAMARGIPVITSSTTALRETGGSAARYVDPDDPDSLADAIAALLDDAVLRCKMRRDGLARVAEFSWDDTARRTRRVYGHAIDMGRVR